MRHVIVVHDEEANVLFYSVSSSFDDAMAVLEQANKDFPTVAHIIYRRSK